MSIREDLKAYLDGELPPARMEEVRAALESDPNLRAEAEFMRQVGIAIREMSAEPEIVGMEKVLGAVSARRKPLSWTRLNWALAGGAACVLVVLVAAKLMLPTISQLSSSADVASTKSAQPADAAKAVLPERDLRGLSNSASPSMAPRTGGRGVAAGSSGPSYGDASAAMTDKSGKLKTAGGARKDMNGPVFEAKAPAPRPAGPQPVASNSGAVTRPAGTWAASSAGTVMLADISIEARDVNKAEAAVRSVAQNQGGFSQPGTPVTADGRSAAKQVALTVPATNLRAALQDIQAVGRVLSSKLTPVSIQAERRQIADQLVELQKQSVAPPAPTGASKRGTVVEPSTESRFGLVDEEIGALKLRQKALAGDNPMPIIIATIEAVTPNMPPPARYVPHAPKPKSRLPLILGASLGVVVLGGLGFLAWLRFGRLRSGVVDLSSH